MGAAVLPHRHRRHRRHLLPGGRHDRQRRQSQPGKIVATAQASNGSLANVTGIAGGAMESGFSQADVATWAQKGTGIFEGKPKHAGLRLIANLYPESVHVVVKKGSGIKSVADLKGKRVALDEPGSGTLSMRAPSWPPTASRKPTSSPNTSSPTRPATR
jgi:hypothetical protein